MGRLYSALDASLALGMNGCFKATAREHLDYSVDAVFLSVSIDCCRRCWFRARMVRAGRGTAPKTRSIGTRTSVPIVLLTANVTILRQSSSDSSPRLSMSRILLKALLKGAWYRSTTPIALGFSLVASRMVIPWEAALDLNSCEMEGRPLVYGQVIRRARVIMSPQT